MLKYELARDLMYDRQQVTVTGFMDLDSSAVLTPLLGKLGARNILGNWAAQIVTFEGSFSRVPWTLQNRAIRI